MPSIATVVWDVEELSAQGLTTVPPQNAAVTVCRHCSSSPPPPSSHGDRSASNSPSSKRRRITAQQSVVPEETRSQYPGHVCLCCVNIELMFQGGEEAFATAGLAHDLQLFEINPTEPDSVQHLDAHIEFIRRLLCIGSTNKKSKLTSQVLSACVTLSFSPSHTSNPCLCLRLLWKTGVECHDDVQKNGAMGLLEKDVLSYYFPPGAVLDSRWDVQTFYESVHVPSKGSIEPPDMPKNLLSCTLYPFQRRSVQWMLQREAVKLSDGTVVRLEDEHPGPRDLAPSFEPCIDGEEHRCFVSHLRRLVLTDVSTLSEDERGTNRGILAEEMGLGKTVELTALICLHRRTIDQPTVFDDYTGTEVKASGATLIITPPGILEQWRRELNNHAPQLRVMHYKGMPSIAAAKRESMDGTTVEDLLNYDVVLTTYSVLSREIHYANTGPKRNFRHAKQHEPRRSPLVQISWWRCCLDEAQMIESGVSQAATVARVIPRVNAWAVSGTPVKRSALDLLGLLIFLRLEPFCSAKSLWNRLDKRTFHDIFSAIASRHSKDQVSNELRLPPQRRIVMLVPLTPIEEQNYKQLFRQMCEDCGLSAQGLPIGACPGLDDPRVMDKMRGWLIRLRQTCLHPHVGGQNRRALGRGKTSLRTVAEVLDVMIEQNDASIRAVELEHVTTQVLRGHVHSFAKSDRRRSCKALDVYREALTLAESYVAAARLDLAEECARLEVGKAAAMEEVKAHSKSYKEEEEEEEVDSDDDKDDRKRGRVATLRKAVRSYLEMQHICAFHVASACYEIKTNKTLTVPDSDTFQEMESMETQFYAQAKAIRSEILTESHGKVEKAMRKVRALSNSPIANLSITGDYSGISSGRITGELDHLTVRLNQQGVQLNEWREAVSGILLTPLVDEEDREATGEEYENSTKAQEELQVYTTMLRAIIADRHRFLTGQTNTFIDGETKTQLKQAKDGRGPAPYLLLELATQRDQLRPENHDGSLRGIIAEVRSLVTSLQVSGDGSDEAASTQLSIAGKFLDNTGRAFNAEAKRLTELDKELELYRSCMNLRVEFYKQLQVLSDQLRPYKDKLDEKLDREFLGTLVHHEAEVTTRLASLKTKQKFFLHLKTEPTDAAGHRLCVICQCDFEVGVITVCGHQYCKECFGAWLKQHHSCPLCKRHLGAGRDFHEITHKPRELRAQEERHATPTSDGQASAGTGSSSIYTELSQATTDEIRSIDLNGSFGTKIDMLSRHVLWIRQNDPGSKSVVFSQYSDFLRVLGDAFRQFAIGFSHIAEKGGIERFKQDVGVECFLLDAKSDASGLNLVNASYVFLMEPLINAAIELQAIARVHRIGQHRPSTVVMYLAVDTVEENIYEMSVQRRLEHMAGQANGRSGSTSGSSTPAVQERALDAANSLEMQQAPMAQLLVQKKEGGEIVDKEDVWNCLFRRGGGPNATSAVASTG